MKIIYLTNFTLPTAKAHGLQVMKMCQVFVKKGVSVELVTGRRFHQLSHANPFIYYNIKERFKIKKIFSIDLIPLQNIIGRLGLWTQSLSFAILAGFYLLFQKTDIIYSRDLFSLFFLSWFKSNLIYEAHTFPKHFFLYKYIFKKVKAIIVITQNLKNFFIERGISGDKILVAPDGVDLGEFNISQSQEQCRKQGKASHHEEVLQDHGPKSLALELHPEVREESGQDCQENQGQGSYPSHQHMVAEGLRLFVQYSHGKRNQ